MEERKLIITMHNPGDSKEALQDALYQLYLKANAAKGRIKYGTPE